MLRFTTRPFLALLILQPLAAAGIGDAAPDWKGLTGADGKRHSLADYGDSEYVGLPDKVFQIAGELVGDRHCAAGQ